MWIAFVVQAFLGVTSSHSNIDGVDGSSIAFPFKDESSCLAYITTARNNQENYWLKKGAKVQHRDDTNENEYRWHYKWIDPSDDYQVGFSTFSCEKF